MKKLLIVVVFSMTLSSCCNKTAQTADYSDPACWVQDGTQINPDFVDVFWFTGTMFPEQLDENGKRTFRAEMNEQQREYLCKATLGTKNVLFPDSLNFFSPCYHQFTFDVIDETQEFRDSLFDAVGDEAYAMFHYYMENMNNGRPYILAGASQGGIMVRNVLKRMTDEEFSKMKVAYCLAFGLSAEDLECPHIIPAKGEFDTGVVVSYNSVADTDGIWDLVHNNAVTCINPANWKTDSTPAQIEYNGMHLTAHIDPAYNLIFVDNYDFSTVGTIGMMKDINYPWFKTNLHIADIPVYAPFLKRNALDRAYGTGK